MAWHTPTLPALLSAATVWFTCQFCVMACHTPTLPVILNGANVSEKPSTVRDLPASSFIVCHTPTLHVVLSAAIMRYLIASSVSWCATPWPCLSYWVLRVDCQWRTGCWWQHTYGTCLQGERTLLFSEVARRFHLTLSTNLNKTVVYGPAKWIYLIHIKVLRSEWINLVDWTKKFNSNLL